MEDMLNTKRKKTQWLFQVNKTVEAPRFCFFHIPLRPRGPHWKIGLWNPTSLVLSPGSAIFQFCNLGRLNFCKLQLLYQSHEDKNTFYFIGLLWWLHEIIHLKCFGQCLVHKKCSLNVCCHYNFVLAIIFINSNVDQSFDHVRIKKSQSNWQFVL